MAKRPPVNYSMHKEESISKEINKGTRGQVNSYTLGKATVHEKDCFRDVSWDQGDNPQKFLRNIWQIHKSNLKQVRQCEARQCMADAESSSMSDPNHF